ncbi:unnamed protein product, partial [marine sediment metagenome]
MLANPANGTIYDNRYNSTVRNAGDQGHIKYELNQGFEYGDT